MALEWAGYAGLTAAHPQGPSLGMLRSPAQPRHRTRALDAPDLIRFTSKTPPAGSPMRRTRTARRRPIVPVHRVGARDVVGVAHVAAGAMAAVAALFVLAMTAEHGSAGERVTAAVMLLLGGGLATAGLWLRDGRRRGAVLAVALDGLRLLLLLLALPRSGALDLAFALALLGGTVWLWPTLDPPAAAARRA